MSNMRKSKFKQPKVVLVFNGARVLVAIVRSLHSVTQLSGANLQAVSFCCTGKYISSGGYYYRHIHPDVLVDISDLDNLKLEDYDEMCGDKRRYHTVREMAYKRNNTRRNKSKNNEEEAQL